MHKVSYNYKGFDTTVDFACAEDALECAMNIKDLDDVFNVVVDSNSGIVPMFIPSKARYEYWFVIDANENGCRWEYSEFRTIEEANRWGKAMKVITSKIVDRTLA